MKWRDQLALLFGVSGTFGLFGNAEALPLPSPGQTAANDLVIDRDAWVYTDPAERQRLLYLAGHRSHSSHSSHRSHSSHYSGTSGTYHSSHYSGTYTAPVYSPPPPPPPPKVSPPPRPRTTSPRPVYSNPAVQADGLEQAAPDTKAANGRPSQDLIRTYVERVQIALTFKGYDPGPVDGRLGQKTKKALKQFQADSSLAPTGNMDVATLRMLGVIK